MLIPARKWRQTSKCSVLTAIFPPACYRHNYYTSIRALLPPNRDGSLTLPIFFFSNCLSFEGLVFRPRYRNCLLCQVYVSIRIHLSAADPRLSDTILSGAKLVTAPLVRKVRARFGATLGAKKISTIIPGQDYSSNSSRPYGSILFRKPCKHFSEHL